jgi:hypothetical protein
MLPRITEKGSQQEDGGDVARGPNEPRFLRVSIRFCLFSRTDHESNIRYLSGCSYREKIERQVRIKNSKISNKHRNGKLMNRKASMCSQK